MKYVSKLFYLFLTLNCILIAYVKSDEYSKKNSVNLQRLSSPYKSGEIPNKFDSDISKIFVVRSKSDLLCLIRNQNPNRNDQSFVNNGVSEKNKLKNIFDVYLAWKSMNRKNELKKSNKDINYKRTELTSDLIYKEDAKIKSGGSNSSRSPKTSISRFPPILEYIVQRIQGYNSVYVVKDQSLWIYQTTPKPDVLDYDEVVHLDNNENCKSYVCNETKPVQNVTLIDVEPTKISTNPNNSTENGQLDNLIDGVNDTIPKNGTVIVISEIYQSNITSNFGAVQISSEDQNTTSNNNRTSVNVGQIIDSNNGTNGNISETDQNLIVFKEPVIIQVVNTSNTVSIPVSETIISNSDQNATANITTSAINDDEETTEVNNGTTTNNHQFINISENTTPHNPSNTAFNKGDSTQIEATALDLSAIKDTNLTTEPTEPDIDQSGNGDVVKRGTS